MNGQRVLITGHRGFVGRNLLDLISSNYPEAIVSDFKDQIPFHSPQDLKSLITDFSPDYVFHLASPKGETLNKDARWLQEHVLQPTTLLLETLLETRPKARIVIPGSAAEYGVVSVDRLPVTEEFEENPVSPYGQSKYSQTLLAKRYSERGLHVSVARIFNIIGKDAPERILVGSFLAKVRAATAQTGRKTISVGNLDIRRDFVDIEDVCRALALIAVSGKSGEVYNICSDHSVSLRDVLKKMISIHDPSIEVLEETGLSPNPVLEIYGSTRKIQQHTGWFPKYRWDESIVRLL